MKKVGIIIVTIAMIFSFLAIIPMQPVAADEAVDYSVGRAVYGGDDGTELFLGGQYIELGISNWGDFGTEGDKPDNFRGTLGGEIAPGLGSNQIGMSADHDGFGVGRDLPVDYYLPGDPEERFVVGYQVGLDKYYTSNCALNWSKNMPTTVTNESNIDAGLLQARIVSVWADAMEITQIVRFRVQDKFYRTEVTIKNLTDQVWDNARYMRSFDPDNSQYRGGDYITENVVTQTIAEDGKAVVMAQTILPDPMYDAIGSRIPFFFYSIDPAAVVSIFGFTNTDPYTPAAYDAAVAKNVVIVDDIGITITWQTLAVAPGESRVFVYYSSLDERDFDEVEDEILYDAAHTISFDAQSGTVSPDWQRKVFGQTYGQNYLGEDELLPIPERADYIFLGWFTEPAGEGDLITDASEVVIDADHTLYANWEAIEEPLVPEIVVSFDAQGGTVTPDWQKKVFGQTYGLNDLGEVELLPIPERADYIFLGWYTEPAGEGYLITDASEVVIDADHTLYANWEAPKTVTVIYQPKDEESGIMLGELAGKIRIPEVDEEGVDEVIIKLIVLDTEDDPDTLALIAKAKAALHEDGYHALAFFNLALLKTVIYADGSTSESLVPNSDILGLISVYIPISEDLLDKDNLLVIFIDEEGEITFLKSERVTVEGIDYLRFETDHFALYAIIELIREPIPQTGRTGLPLAFWLLVCMAGWALTSRIYWKRH